MEYKKQVSGAVLSPTLKKKFWRWNFLALYFSYISGSNFLSSKNNKKPL